MLRVRISRLEQSHVQIEINDTGPGFSQNIIDAFERRDQFLQSTTGGAGFGLMLARNIIENQHEGTLQIGNNENGGARIKIKLPVKSTNERNK